MMNAEKAILTRRSTRKFKDLHLNKEALERIVEAGRHAPSGGNSQCTHFFVITDQKLLKELAERVQDAFAKMELKEGMYKSLASSIRQSKTGKYVFHYSPAALIVTASKKDYGNNIADCACALENMMILVNEMDLGSCWINQLRWLNEDEGLLTLFRSYGLAEDERIYGALAVSIPDTEDSLPARTPLPRTGNPVEWI